jgi:hypothetical protein
VSRVLGALALALALVGGTACAAPASPPHGGHALRVKPVRKPWQQPYGGCKEAVRFPHSQGYRECRIHGYVR